MHGSRSMSFSNLDDELDLYQRRAKEKVTTDDVGCGSTLSPLWRVHPPSRQRSRNCTAAAELGISALISEARRLTGKRLTATRQLDDELEMYKRGPGVGGVGVGTDAGTGADANTDADGGASTGAGTAADASTDADASTGVEDGAELFARLQAISPEVQREDYYDAHSDSWDVDGLQSDLAVDLEHHLKSEIESSGGECGDGGCGGGECGANSTVPSTVLAVAAAASSSSAAAAAAATAAAVGKPKKQRKVERDHLNRHLSEPCICPTSCCCPATGHCPVEGCTKKCTDTKALSDHIWNHGGSRWLEPRWNHGGTRCGRQSKQHIDYVSSIVANAIAADNIAAASSASSSATASSSAATASFSASAAATAASSSSSSAATSAATSAAPTATPSAATSAVTSVATSVATSAPTSAPISAAAAPAAGRQSQLHHSCLELEKRRRKYCTRKLKEIVELKKLVADGKTLNRPDGRPVGWQLDGSSWGPGSCTSG